MQAKSQSFQFRELCTCIQTLKTATVKQFINKNHVDLEAAEDNSISVEFMIDIVQTVTQIIKQKVEISNQSKERSDDSTTLKVKQIN